MDPITKTTVTMEESSAVTTHPHEKRKFEPDPEEEISEESGDEETENSGDEETENNGDEETEKSGEVHVDTEEILQPTWWKEPEWDVDSFDGMEYNSAEEENECSDSDDERKWRTYKRLVIESKGFYVEPDLGPKHCFSLGFLPVPDKELDTASCFDQTYREFFTNMACLCLDKYNKQNGFTVKFEEIVRVVYTAGPRWKSYITFMAKEKPDGPLVEYQAKVLSTVTKGQDIPILCRPAPPAKTSILTRTTKR